MRRLLFILLFTPLTIINAQRPTVTIVCVVDQLAEHLLTRHHRFLSGGLKKLLDQGLVYHNAHYPHAQPATATGHAALSTGASASTHGIIANEWAENGKIVKACDDADVTHSGVFGHSPYRTKGKSARAMNAPTLTRSCLLQEDPFTSLSLSLKSRAAIPTAGQYGTAIWFNSKKGEFTSSKSFGPRLPAWARVMNKKYLKTIVHKQEKTQWKSRFASDHPAYQYVSTKRYSYTGYPFGLVNNPRPMRSGRKPFFLFQQTPQANKALFNLARLAVRMSRREKKEQSVLLWLSLSTLDYVGHYYGPNSREAIDMLYHIDQQLDHFITKVEAEYGANNCLWALTADHGIMPIPEHEYARGRTNAQRLDTTALLKDLNHGLYTAFNIKNLMSTVLASNFYVDQVKWQYASPEMQKDIIAFVKNYLTAITGITHVWHATDFKTIDFVKKYGVVGREHWFQNQYYPGRSGDFVVQVDPYTYLTEYDRGTSHDSPYDYDVRVPLVLYGPGRITPGAIHDRVSLLQLPTTLAYLLNVPRPAKAPVKRLVGIK